MDSHPQTIEQKGKIILQQFTGKTARTINGKGRALVVLRSRYHCVLFQQEMVKQMKEMGLPYSVLVAFSGSVRYGGRDAGSGMQDAGNGMKDAGSGIRDKGGDGRYSEPGEWVAEYGLDCGWLEGPSLPYPDREQ